MHQQRTPGGNSLVFLVRVVAALFVLAAAPSTAAGQPQFPPGLRIGLVPPPGMTLSQSFLGFEDQRNEVSIQIAELPAQAHPQAARDFSPDYLVLQSMEVKSRETIKLAEGEALLVATRTLDGTLPITKYGLLALVNNVTVLVIALVPDRARHAYPETAVRAALASIVVRPPLPPAEMVSALPYTFNDFAGFRPVQANPGGSATLTDGPLDAALPVQQPLVLVNLRFEDTQGSSREEAARRALARLSGIDRLREISAQDIRVNGLPGHEIVGEIVDPRFNVKLTMVQWLLFGNGAYIQIHALARSDVWDSVFPRLRAIRDGIGPK